MPARPGPDPTRLALLAALSLAACAPEAPPRASAAPPGPECAALLAAGERAAGCDARLVPLVAELRASPDEPRCRAAARLLLDPPARARGRVVSVYERAPAPDPTPLSAAELAALAALPLPGTLVVTPELAPGPGVPVTTATLGEVALASEAGGRLRGARAPGEHQLTLRHAGQEALACVTLEACAEVRLTARGAELGTHAALRPGPCAAGGGAP